MSKITEQSMIIDGIAGAETVDSSGEILDVKGCDISSLKEGKAVLNWEHQGPPKNDEEKKKNVLDTPKNAIGKIIFAKKIFKADECDGPRETFFWNKVKVPLIYIKARLYDGSGHEDAKAAAASFRDAVIHKEAPIINFSIEGHTIEKEANRIKVSMARAVAATHKPCNKAAVATVLHDPVTGEKHDIEGKKDDVLSSLAEVEKNEVPGKQTLSSVPIDYDCVVEEDPRHLLKMAVENLGTVLRKDQMALPMKLNPEPHESHEFKQWFGPSKIVHEGAPLLVHHGTNKEFTEFQEGKPAWFTPNERYGFIQHSPRVIKGYLALKNPFFTDNQNHAENWGYVPEKIAELKAQGYDGIVYSAKGNLTRGYSGWGDDAPQFVAFDPRSQFKSIENMGTWDAQDPNFTKEEIQPLEKMAQLSYDTPEFQSWFQGSAVHDNGQPLRVYTGTSKDVDFHTFKIGNRGAWFSTNPEVASQYAMQNDSMDTKLDRYTMKFNRVNTASRVIPAHLSIKNPYKMTPADLDAHKMAPDYARFQGNFFAQLRAKGHDGVDFGDGTWVAFHPHQIKSIFNNKPTMQKPIHKSEGEPLEKTLTAGGYNAAPGTLTGGACLQREDLKQVAKKKVLTKFFKNQILGALRDFDPYVHKSFRDFLKSRLPEVDDSFIDYFTEVAEDFKVQKSEEQRLRRVEWLTIELVKAGTLQNMGPTGNSAGYQATVFGLGTQEPSPPVNPVSTHGQTPGLNKPHYQKVFQPQPITINKDLHTAPHLHIRPEQHALVHGLDVNQRHSEDGIQMKGISNSRTVKLPQGGHGIMKQGGGVDVNSHTVPTDTHAEVLYHNAAHGFFGLGKYVPTTSLVVHPTNNQPHSVMQMIPNARHYYTQDQNSQWIPDPRNVNVLKQHGDAGELDKMAIMDGILGNIDRHEGNYMFDDNQIHLIDHGYSFDLQNKDINDQHGYQPTEPDYLTQYHRLLTGTTDSRHHYKTPIHPEAAKWVMGLNPQMLQRFMRSQGLSMERSMALGKRLTAVQRLIQRKGLATGIWEAYNAPYGENSRLGDDMRQSQTPLPVSPLEALTPPAQQNPNGLVDVNDRWENLLAQQGYK